MSSDLINYDELPHWLGDNRFIITGYRKPYRSLFYYLKSMFTLHNETANIWTHIFGVVYYIRLINMISYPTHSRYNNCPDILPLLFFYIAGTFAFFSSTIYHTFSFYSSEVRQLLVKYVH